MLFLFRCIPLCTSRCIARLYATVGFSCLHRSNYAPGWKKRIGYRGLILRPPLLFRLIAACLSFGTHRAERYLLMASRIWDLVCKQVRSYLVLIRIYRCCREYSHNQKLFDNSWDTFQPFLYTTRFPISTCCERDSRVREHRRGSL